VTIADLGEESASRVWHEICQKEGQRFRKPINRNATMPTLADLRVRFASPPRAPAMPVGTDEILVVDARSKMSPAQIVEQKLRQALCASRTATGALLGHRWKKSSH
jgi:hypothetical protein